MPLANTLLAFLAKNLKFNVRLQHSYVILQLRKPFTSTATFESVTTLVGWVAVCRTLHPAADASESLRTTCLRKP